MTRAALGPSRPRERFSRLRLPPRQVVRCHVEMMRSTRSALAVGFLFVLVACGERVDHAPDAALATAVERTLAAESFQIRLTVTDGRDRLVNTIEYAAPDRVRIRFRPIGETVSIAGDMYYSTPEEPGRFFLVETRCENPLEVAVPALSIVRAATEVRRNGSILVFRSDDVAEMTGQARIADGYLVSLLLRYELPDVNRRVIERYAFSRFGDEISVEPPAASSIVRAPGSPASAGSPAPCPDAPSAAGIVDGG
jgi:hypothetical protein